MSTVVSGFSGAGAAALVAPASSADALSADALSHDHPSPAARATAFGALLSALTGATEASAHPVGPATATDAGATEPTTPHPVTPAPTPAVFLGSVITAPASPAATPVTDAAPAPSPTTPGEGSHGKGAPARTTAADRRQDAPSPAVVDALAAGQPALQQAVAAAPVPPATPTPAASVQTSAAAAGVEAPSAPPTPLGAPAPAPSHVQAPSAQPVATAAPAAGAQSSAPPAAAAPARSAAKAPSAQTAPSDDAAQPTTPTATPVPPQAPAPAFATSLAAASAVSTAPAPTPAPPLQQQLAQPVMTLARQPDGDHVVVVRVAPDDLGPVTVRAQVSGTGVHIELFAPSDAGRDAIRQILTDLRRDLNATTANASVSVSDQNAPGAEGGGGGRSPWASAEERGSATPSDRPEEPAPARDAVPAQPRVLAGARTLDLVV